MSDERQAEAWSLWLDCLTEQEIADRVDVTQQTVSNWVTATKERQLTEIGNPPGSTPERPWGIVQHFDVWNMSGDGRP